MAIMPDPVPISNALLYFLFIICLINVSVSCRVFSTFLLI